MTVDAFTNEAIAFTEKRMDMTLDDIIKMPKPSSSKAKKQRTSNKSTKLFSGTQNKSLKAHEYMNSRSSLRQRVLAQRKTNFQGSRFPSVSEAAKKAVVAPFHNRGYVSRNRTTNWNRPRTGAPIRQQGNGPAGRGIAPKRHLQQQQHNSQQQSKLKTLDSLFANIMEQRMRTFGHPSNVGCWGAGTFQQRWPWGRGQRYQN